MIERLRRRLRHADPEAGLTLVELLVASAMGVVLAGVAGMLVVGALQSQPRISEKAANVQTARWVLERMTRELRNGYVVDVADPDTVSFQTNVRHDTCGGSGTLAAGTDGLRCEVTYSCADDACTRTESAPGVFTGTPRTIFSGLSTGAGDIFDYSPSADSDATYVGITLTLPDPDGPGALTVSDGVSLRNATLSN